MRIGGLGAGNLDLSEMSLALALKAFRQDDKMATFYSRAERGRRSSGSRGPGNVRAGAAKSPAKSTATSTSWSASVCT